MDTTYVDGAWVNSMALDEDIYHSRSLSDAIALATRQANALGERNTTEALAALSTLPFAPTPDPRNDLDSGAHPDAGVDWAEVEFPTVMGFLGTRDLISVLSRSASSAARWIAVNLEQFVAERAIGVYESDVVIISLTDDLAFPYPASSLTETQLQNIRDWR